MSNSKFIVIAAPSGSGKTTIVNRLLKDKSLSLSFSISATSRAPRNNEVDGINYFFLTKDEFIKKIENKEFDDLYNDDDSTLKKTWKKTLSKVHPDKGGDSKELDDLVRAKKEKDFLRFLLTGLGKN